MDIDNDFDGPRCECCRDACLEPVSIGGVDYCGDDCYAAGSLADMAAGYYDAIGPTGAVVDLALRFNADTLLATSLKVSIATETRRAA